MAAIQIDFTFPDIQHPKGDVTVLEVAKLLEAKYHILENFCTYIIPKFQEKRINKLILKGEAAFVSEQEWLKNEWREYLIGGKTGVTTQAALFRGDPSFIDTSSYYLSMQPIFKFVR